MLFSTQIKFCYSDFSQISKAIKAIEELPINS